MNWLIENWQTITAATAAVVIAIAHLLAILPLPQDNVLIRIFNALAGNYGNAKNAKGSLGNAP